MADSVVSAAILSPPSRFIGLFLLGLVASELIFLYSGTQEAGVASRALVALLPLLAWRELRLREGYLLGLCLILIYLTWHSKDSLSEFISDGLSRSAYLASFILLMALLREGALTSSSVLKLGTFLTRQPASRRFVALFCGSHFFAVLINLGALSLLAPIIQRGVRSSVPHGAPLDEIAHVRERRQLSAVLRGFSWFLVWAPTAVTQAVMPTLISGIDGTRLILAGLGLAVSMLLVSWAEDTLRWRGFRKRLRAEGRLPLPSETQFPFRAAGKLGLVCLALFVSSLAFTAYFNVSIVTGVMLAAPLVVLTWVFVQKNRETGKQCVKATAERIDEIAFMAIPSYVREAVFIACAGFIGTLAAKLVPAADVAAAMDLANQPRWLVLWLLSATVWIFGQAGLSPITMAVFLGSLVAELPNIPVDLTFAALAIAAGTAVCTTGAPFSSGAIMLARATGYSSVTLTWRWNGLYTALVFMVLAMFYALLTIL